MPLVQEPVASPFNSRSTAEEVMGNTDLSGKTAIVTGASAGLGIETARVLAKAGAHVVMAVRTREKGEAAAANIRKENPKASVEVADLDLADYDSVRKFADGFLASGRKLDLLINNAGIMATPLRRNAQGYESQFASNHLGHFLLTGRLAPALLKAGKARVVSLSSVGHRRSPVLFDDPNFKKTDYDKWVAYGQAKSANALFAVELNRRMESKGVTAYSVHPGGIQTELTRDLVQADIDSMRNANANRPGNDAHRKNIPQGAATTIWAATSPLLNGGGGVYCENCNVAEAVEADHAGMDGARPWIRDADHAQLLWNLSEILVGEQFNL